MARPAAVASPAVRDWRSVAFAPLGDGSAGVKLALFLIAIPLA